MLWVLLACLRVSAHFWCSIDRCALCPLRAANRLSLRIFNSPNLTSIHYCALTVPLMLLHLSACATHAGFSSSRLSKKDKLWLVMEYCGGGSCADLLESLGPLPEPFIASICKETLSGLLYLHTNHKLHRDVKGAHSLAFPAA